jgi:hypothetical protein
MNNKQRLKIFDNDLIDFVFAPNPVWIFILGIFFILYLVYKALNFSANDSNSINIDYFIFGSERFNFFYVILVIFIGYLVWTFFEYILYRFIFYRLHSCSTKLHFILYGIHKIFPNDT